MKKTFIAALLLAGLATSGMAQNRGNQIQAKDGGRSERGHHRTESPEQQARMATDRMEKQLSLTDKQKSEVYKINLDRARKMVVSREKAQKQRLEQMKRLKSERAESEKKLSRILNSEQQAKYASMQKSRKEGFKDRKRSGDRNKDDVARRDSSKRSRVAVRPSR